MKDNIQIAFCGDFMPGGVLKEGCFSSDIKALFSDFDLRVATLECALGDNLPFDKEKMEREDWRTIIYAPNKAISLLKELNINIVTLANNHTYDLGVEGLKNTLRILDENNILHAGAGLTKEEASKPAVVTINNKTYAFLAYMSHWWEATHPATEKEPGLNLFYIDKVIEDVKRYKKVYDYVFVLPHWGTEYTSFPTSRTRNDAFRIIKAGADGIFGSHSHQVQPVLRIENQWISYSMGNFVFPDFYMQPTRPIWYPTQKDLSDIGKVPDSDIYPKHIEKPVKRVWKKINRVGIVNIWSRDSTNKSNVNTVFVQLSKDNVLYIYDDLSTKFLKVRLNIIAWVTRRKLYSFVHQIFSRISHRLCKRN